MGCRRAAATISTGLLLSGLGAGAVLVGQRGMWAACAGAIIILVWFLALACWAALRPRRMIDRPERLDYGDEVVVLRSTMDAMPMPLLEIEGEIVSARNRAARLLFNTGDRVLSAPAGLSDQNIHSLTYEGRTWRIHRVHTLAYGASRMIVGLIDIAAEERTAEARATADMIQILGHELLNGLAPVVSLLESAVDAVEEDGGSSPDLRALMRMSARRAEGLLRFMDAYRALARLPEPTFSTVQLTTFASDMEKLFESRWRDQVTLKVSLDDDMTVRIDCDQMSQAVWALLQNGAEAAMGAPGHPRVELHLRVQPGAIVIEVTDSGKGVDRGEIDQIFRPFHTSKPAGTGIGLSLARQIVHAHGGELRLVSPHPATFRISLPLGDRSPVNAGELGAIY